MNSTKINKIHETRYEVYGTSNDNKNIIYIGFIRFDEELDKYRFKPAFIDFFGYDCLSTITNKINELNNKNETEQDKIRKLR